MWLPRVSLQWWRRCRRVPRIRATGCRDEGGWASLGLTGLDGRRPGPHTQVWLDHASAGKEALVGLDFDFVGVASAATSARTRGGVRGPCRSTRARAGGAWCWVQGGDSAFAHLNLGAEPVGAIHPALRHRRSSRPRWGLQIPLPYRPEMRRPFPATKSGPPPKGSFKRQRSNGMACDSWQLQEVARQADVWPDW